jgi:hypothetical protein
VSAFNLNHSISGAANLGADLEHLCAAGRARTRGSGLAVLHGRLRGVLHLPLCLALNAVGLHSPCHLLLSRRLSGKIDCLLLLRMTLHTLKRISSFFTLKSDIFSKTPRSAAFFLSPNPHFVLQLTSPDGSLYEGLHQQE